MAIAYLCLSLIVFLIPLLGGKSGVLPVAVFTALAAGGWTGWALARQRSAPAAFPLRWPLLALVLITLVTTVTSVYQTASLLIFWQVVAVAAIGWLACILPLTRKQLAVGAAVFCLGVLLGALNGLSAWFTWYLGKGLLDWRVQSTWENANFYAAFLLAALPPSIVLIRYARQSGWRLYAAAVALVGVLALVMTQSRGGLLSFLIVLLLAGPLWLWVEKKLSARSIGWLALGLAVLIGLALISPVGKRVLDPRVRAEQFHSQMFRYYTWIGDLRMIRAHPLWGTGPGTFASAFGKYQVAGYTRHGHQIFLQAAAETGVPGLLVLLWLFAGLLLLGVRGLRADAPAVPDVPPHEKPGKVARHAGKALPAAPTPAVRDLGIDAFLPDDPQVRRGLAVALLASTAGVMLHGLLDSTWLYIGIPLTLVLQAALVGQLNPAKAPPSPAPGWVRVLAPAVLVLIAISLVPGVIAEQSMEQATFTTDATERAALYRRAVEMAPGNAAYLRRFAFYVPEKEAEQYLRQAQALEPTNAANWLFQGHFVQRYRTPQAAAEAYRTAIEKQPDLLSAYYGLAQVSWKAGNAVQARQALDGVLQTIGSPRDRYFPVDVPEPWYTLAWYAEGQLALKDGDSAKAARNFDQALAAADKYQQGFTEEAKAVAAISGDDEELGRIQALASVCHEKLAELLAKTDPAAAARHRKAVDAKLDLEKLRNEPFP